MTITKLPGGRWRARVWKDGKDVSVAKVLGLPRGTTWATKREARTAYEDARRALRAGGSSVGETTVAEFWNRWTTDPLFRRPKASTNINYREGTRAFVERYGTMAMSAVGDYVVAEWLAGGQRNSQVPPLRVMFNDAMSPKSGRIVRVNPFARLGIGSGTGNRDAQPPSQEMVWDLIRAASVHGGPYLGAWFQVAAFTGMRPGELDALRWDAIDFEASRILVAEQFSPLSCTFTLPKNGKRRFAPLTGPAREALLGIAPASEFCFVNLRGDHWTRSSRAYHWKAMRAATGYTGTLYLATRHVAGAYMINVLGLASEDVAIALGHTDGGELVRKLYGHRNVDLALARVVAAYEAEANKVVPFRRREEAG